MSQRGVWALPYQGPLLSTVEEVVETVDRAAASAAVVRRVRRSATASVPVLPLVAGLDPARHAELSALRTTMSDVWLVCASFNVWSRECSRGPSHQRSANAVPSAAAAKT